MDEADEAIGDFGNPPIHQRPHPVVLQTGKNIPSVVELRKPGADALHQSGSGGVPLIASAEHVTSGIPVLGVDYDAAEFPGGEPGPQIDLAAGDDGAAHAGSVCEAQEIGVSPPGAVMSLPGGSAVHIVLHADGDLESGLQDFPDVCAGIAGNVLVCVQDRPLFRIHLTGAADADGLEIMIPLQDLLHPSHDMGSAQTSLGGSLPYLMDLTLLPYAGFDAGAADIRHSDSDVMCAF